MDRASLERICDARTRHPLLVLEAYCRADACAAREVTIEVKDYDSTLCAEVERRGLSCPVCGGPMVLHWVCTRHAHESTRERDARLSVNEQMFQRDAGGTNGPVPVPASVLLKDDLPPTPDGWWK